MAGDGDQAKQAAPQPKYRLGKLQKTTTVGLSSVQQGVEFSDIMMAAFKRR